MLEFKDLLEYCQAIAVSGKLEPTEESVWRSICRSYSKNFSTPLHEVMALDPMFVIMTHYENQLDEIDGEERLEDLLDTIYSLSDPDHEDWKRRDLENFIEQAEAEENERIKAGRPIHRDLKNETSLKSLPEKQPEIPKNQPTGGYLDLSYLEKEEMGGQGFDDESN